MQEERTPRDGGLTWGSVGGVTWAAMAQQNKRRPVPEDKRVACDRMRGRRWQGDGAQKKGLELAVSFRRLQMVLWTFGWPAQQIILMPFLKMKP